MSKMEFAVTDLNTLKQGDYSLFTKTLSDTDAMLFAGISGDMSPLHMNEMFASSTELKTRTVHPMLVASIAGGAVFRLLHPSVRTNERNFKFLKPVFAGDTVTACAKVEHIDTLKNEVHLELTCYNQDEEMVMSGNSIEVIVAENRNMEE